MELAPSPHSASVEPEPLDAPTLPRLAERGARLVGLRFGSFVTQKVLGCGGIGTVLLAEHPLIHKRVAIKVLHEHLATHPQVVARFLSEARTMSLVQHENVVTVFDMGSREGLPYFVMEYLEGQSLADFVRARGPLAPAQAVALLSQVCEVLKAVHERGLVHGDLKPSNLFLVSGRQGALRVKLLDFGIARRSVQDDGRSSPASSPAGTPAFMAPEQCRGQPVDARTDLYAVGVLGYLLLTGKLPVPGQRSEELLAARLEREPTPAHQVQPGVPEDLSAVLQRALRGHPEERFSSATELSKALQGALSAPERGPSLTARLGATGPLLPCERVGRTGLFLRTEAPVPPLLAEVALTLLLPGGELSCTGQVVHHVPVAQARAWGRAAGFAVQLRQDTACFEQAFSRLLAGPGAQQAEQGDAAAEPELGAVRAQLAAGDHYTFLGLPKNAEPAAIRQRSRELRERLELLRSRPLSSAQRRLAERALERVAQALRVLGCLEQRAEYDAGLRNPEGVLRCLAAGLTATSLEACRQRFLARYPAPDGHVLLHLASGDAFLAACRQAEALEAYEAALRVDPLHLEALKRWHGLKRRAQGAAAAVGRR